MPTRTAASRKISPELMETTWAGLLTADDGSWVAFDEHPDRTFQALGTFGGGSVAIQGTNEATPGSAVFTLTTPGGAPLSFAAAGGGTSAEAPRWVRPIVLGGDGTTSLTVVMVARR